MWSTNTVPDGYLICDGSAVSRTTYAELFGVIGTTYGAGNGSTTFNLPNYKGKVGVGKNSADTDFSTIGKTGGEKEHTLTVEEMPSHAHPIRYYSGSVSDYLGGSTADYGLANSTTYTGTYSSVIAPTGGDQPHNNLQPYIVNNFIIKYKNFETVSLSDLTVNNLTVNGDITVTGTPNIEAMKDYIVEIKDDQDGWCWRKYNSGRFEAWLYKSYGILSFTTAISLGGGTWYRNPDYYPLRIDMPFTVEKIDCVNGNWKNTKWMMSTIYNYSTYVAYYLVQDSQGASNNNQINLYVSGRYK